VFSGIILKLCQKKRIAILDGSIVDPQFSQIKNAKHLALFLGEPGARATVGRSSDF
jgi:hypothetical protein